jgi:hypothetical protein
VLDWTLDNLSADEVARLRAVYEPLTESVRELIVQGVCMKPDLGITRAVRQQYVGGRC